MSPSRSGSSRWPARASIEVGLNSLARDPELEAGARAHFEDPLYYAQAYADRVEDASYYHDLAMKHGAVLEHGVGNGRVALPIARAGASVTGIDHSQPMLDHLRERLKDEPAAVRRRVKLVEGDFRTTRLGQRFPLVICPFNAALHLYTRHDVERWLDRVREHLLPEGELVFDISMPIPKDLARDPAVPYRTPPFDHPTAGRVRYREHFDYDAVRQILFVSMFFEPAKARGSGRRAGEELMTPLAHRQFYPCEMEALLHYNGFEVTALYGDFDRGPLVQGSDVMVWHARPRRARARRRTA
jgi:SAM-dependent methyltransferase